MARRIRYATRQQREADANPDLAIIAQLDSLQDAADQERDRRLGQGWFEEVRNFFNIDPATYSAPTFRPRVVIPELQVLMLNEATDLSDALPRIFITHKTERDKDREKAYQENWRQSFYNNRLLEAEIWALFGGTGFVQVGFDPHSRFGKGEVYLESRDPDTVHPDPGTKDWKRWAYVQFDDRMYIDEVRSIWPDTGYRVIPRRGPGPGLLGSGGSPGVGLNMLPGPMTAGPGLTQRMISADSVVNVRHSFIRDYTVKEISKEERERLRETLDPLIAVPSHRKMYPNGRWIVDCEGVVLADGPNPFPLGLFPIIPYRSMPSLGWFWGVPPIRYTRTLQQIAERMYTQTYENAVRLNNGIWFIDEATGLDADSFAGLPAEIQVINSNSKVPEVKWPTAMPAHMTQLPAALLDLQRRLQGFTPSRAGQTSPGNQSADLYDSTIFQSQFLTRLRSRLMAEPTQATAELVFYTMCRFYKDGAAFAGVNGGDVQWTKWNAMDENLDDYNIILDPGSLRPVSMTAMRSLVTELLQKGQIPLKFALEAMEFPNADEIAEAQQQQLELAALSKVKRPR
jgi:hypothetical protein